MKFLTLVFILLSSISFGQTPVLFDAFQTGIPLYYSMVDSDGLTPNAAVSEYTSAWISAVDPDDPTNKVASSTSYFTPAGRADRWLITPQMTLGAFGNSLSWNGKSHDATYPEAIVKDRERKFEAVLNDLAEKLPAFLEKESFSITSMSKYEARLAPLSGMARGVSASFSITFTDAYNTEYRILYKSDNVVFDLQGKPWIIDPR